LATELSFDAKTLTALIIDDHIPIRKAIRRVLVSMNFADILEVSDGDEAIKVLQSKPVDFVIADLYMRKVDGFEVIRHLREREVGSDVPIIVVTGEASKEDIVQTVDLGTDDYLLKPFHADELEKKVVAVLNKYHSPGPLLKQVRDAERLLLQQNYLEAMATLEKAILLDSSSMRARHAKAVVLEKLGHRDEAVALLRENIQMNPSYYKNYGTLGDISLKASQTAQAIESIRKELHLNPKNPNRQVQLAKLLQSSHDTEGAIYHFREALKMNSRNPVALIGMGRAYANHDNLDKALYYFKRLRRYHPGATKALEAIIKYSLEAGEPKKAEMALRDEKNANPDRLDTYIILAKFYAATERKDDALNTIEELIKKRPDFLPGLKFKGEILAHYGMFAEAAEVFRATLAKDADPKILLKLAETYLALKRYSEAIDVYHKTFQSNFNPAAVFYGLGQAYLFTKQITKAYYALSKAIKLGIENPTVIAQRKRCLQILRTRRGGINQIAS